MPKHPKNREERIKLREKKKAEKGRKKPISKKETENVALRDKFD